MTQKNKELLLKDLCARIPHKVIVETISYTDETSRPWFGELSCKDLDCFIHDVAYKSIKPYLRPMSSMTEEEAKELLFVRLVSKYGESCAYIKKFIKLNEVSFRKESPYEGSIAVWFSFENKIHDTLQIREYSKCEYLGQINDITLAEIDWLNENMFDFRGLIDKGLAIEVTEENNPYK